MSQPTSVSLSAQDLTLLNLTRLVDRLTTNILHASAALEHALRTHPYERTKARSNIAYAKDLLLRAEQDAVGIKVHARRQEIQLGLLKKREGIARIEVRLGEIEAAAAAATAEGEGVDEVRGGEDLLALIAELEAEDNQDEKAAIADETRPVMESVPLQTKSTLYETAPAVLRSRTNKTASDMMPSANTTSLSTTPILQQQPQSPPAETAMTETLLTHNRTEQEALTTSMLSMAVALKQSSRAFATSLELEKDVLNRAGGGLEKNTASLEAAQRRMGVLRRMSEGKGWWGRILLYAWIFGLAITAFLIVAVGPKLRF